VELKRYGIMLVIVCLTAVFLSWMWKVPYLYTAIGFAAWAFAGHLITIDDDLPGGWSNPNGDIPFPWAELAIKATILFSLLGLVFLVPSLQTLGV
jgi:hypothetical protein